MLETAVLYSFLNFFIYLGIITFVVISSKAGRKLRMKTIVFTKEFIESLQKVGFNESEIKELICELKRKYNIQINDKNIL